MKATPAAQNILCTVDITRFIPREQPLTAVIRRHLAQTRALLDKLDQLKQRLDSQLKDLEAQDKMGNFEIQRLMSDFNQAQALASSIQKKRDDVGNAVIQKI